MSLVHWRRIDLLWSGDDDRDKFHWEEEGRTKIKPLILPKLARLVAPAISKLLLTFKGPRTPLDCLTTKLHQETSSSHLPSLMTASLFIPFPYCLRPRLSPRVISKKSWVSDNIPVFRSNNHVSSLGSEEKYLCSKMHLFFVGDRTNCGLWHLAGLYVFVLTWSVVYCQFICLDTYPLCSRFHLPLSWINFRVLDLLIRLVR